MTYVPERSPGFRAWAATSRALAPATHNEEHLIDYAKEPEDTAPRWPSTIPYIQTHCRGFYGLSVILGSEGTGKTMLALASCIEAAATREWQVVYFSAELDDYEIGQRLAGYFRAHPGALDCQDFLHVMHVGKGQGPADLQQDVEAETDPEGPPILICLDSINTISELSGGAYLTTLKDYALWAMLSRRISNGLASFLVVSETNQLGGAKGGKLQFWADQVTKLNKRGVGSGGLAPVELELRKSRRTAGEGSMGVYLRDPQRGRFVLPGDVEPLRSAG